MGIATDLARIKGNITAALAAIADKGVTVPDVSTSDALAGLIASIETGGSSSSIRVEQGSVTFTTNTTSYTFIDDEPDIFIAYVETDANPTYSSSQFIWALFQYKDVKKEYIFGYNKGGKNYYTPYFVNIYTAGGHTTGNYNAYLGATTYKWYAIYGVTAT